MKILVIGDVVVSCDLLEEAARSLYPDAAVCGLTWETGARAEFQVHALNIEKNGPEAELPPKKAFEEITDADVLLVHFCPVPRALIEAGVHLSLIGTCRGGMEHIDVSAATEHNIPVIHCIRNAECTADFAVGLILAETRNIARGHAALMQGLWRKDYVNSGYTTSLCDMTLGVVGLGHIGRLVARKCLGLGMRSVLAYDPYVNQEGVDEASLGVKMVDEDELFSTADVVSLHLRLTPETKESVGMHQLELMKPTAYLINTSRAGVLCKDALIRALQEKSIGGCALDVFWEEPLTEDDPLLALDNVTITPHNAGNVVDALPKSPLLLARTIKEYEEAGTTAMVVNAAQLTA